MRFSNGAILNCKIHLPNESIVISSEEVYRINLAVHLTCNENEDMHA